jgi:ribonuclease HII
VRMAPIEGGLERCDVPSVVTSKQHGCNKDYNFQEMKRPTQLAALLDFDRELKTSGGNASTTERHQQLSLFPSPKTSLLVGVDEVGRGCLAGPVMAGAVILPEIDPNSDFGKQLGALRDSKQLSANQREKLAGLIKSCALYAFGTVGHEEIDQLNILQASLLAMERAVVQVLRSIPHKSHDVVVLVDGKKPLKDLTMRQIPISLGDTLSASIAAASIVAKVERDKLMLELATQFPGYHLEKNKGYPSKEHIEAVSVLGMSSIHRRSFYCHSSV